MGQHKTFKCTHCSYSVQVSGGDDIGFFVETSTYMCTHCEELMDLAVGHPYLAPSGAEPQPRCEICKKEDGLQKWHKKKRPCPKCFRRMDVDPNAEVIMWD